MTKREIVWKQIILGIVLGLFLFGIFRYVTSQQYVPPVVYFEGNNDCNSYQPQLSWTFNGHRVNSDIWRCVQTTESPIPYSLAEIKCKCEKR